MIGKWEWRRGDLALGSIALVWIGFVFANLLALGQTNGPNEADVPVGRVEWVPTEFDRPYFSTITGSVVDEASKQPVPSAMVRILHPETVRQPQSAFVVIADREGRFRFENVPTGREYAIYAHKDGRISTRNPNRIQLVKLVRGGQKQEVSLVLHRVPEMTIRLQDQETQAPLADVSMTISRYLFQPLQNEIEFIKPIPSIRQIHLSDENGAVVTGFMPGEFWVSLRKEGYRAHKRRIYLHQPLRKPLVLTMDRGGELFGQIRDRDGKPIPRAKVSLSADERHTWTDESGFYRISGLDLDAERSVTMTCSGFKPSRIPGVTFPALSRKKELNIWLLPNKQTPTPKPKKPTSKPVLETPETTALKIQLLDIQERPIGNAKVLICQWVQTLEGFTDDHGYLRLPQRMVINGNLHAKFYIPEHGNAELSLRKTELAGLEGHLRAVFQKRKTLKAKFVDVLGNPIQGVEILTVSNLGFPYHFWREELFTSGPDGRISFDDVQDKMRLEIKATGYQKRMFSVDTIPSEELVITLSKPMRFLGQVVDASGMPIEEFNVLALGRPNVYHNQVQEPTVVFNPQGIFEVRNLALDSPFRIFVSAPGHVGKVFGPFPPKHNETGKPRELVLDKDVLTLKGRVFDLKKKPIVNARVWAAVFDRRHQSLDYGRINPMELRTKSLAQFTAFTDGEGRFVLENVPAHLNVVLYVFAKGMNTSMSSDPHLDHQNQLQPIQVWMSRAAKLKVMVPGDLAERVVYLVLKSAGGSQIRETLVGANPPPWVIDDLKSTNCLIAAYSDYSSSFKRELLAEKPVALTEGEETLVVLESNR